MNKENEHNSFVRPIRGLNPGTYLFFDIMPQALESPAVKLVETDKFPAEKVFGNAIVKIVQAEGFCWVDDKIPCIMLAFEYYRTGSDLDLYLDLLHEAVHIRQVMEGRNIWDETYPYHLRPTEIEGYAVAVSECFRLGLKEKDILEHLSNPWMTPAQVSELFEAVKIFLRNLKTTITIFRD